MCRFELVNFSLERRQPIIQTLQILLAAGCNTIGRDRKRFKPLNELISDNSIVVSEQVLSEQFLLTHDLIKLLVMHGSKLILRPGNLRAMLNIINKAKGQVIRIDMFDGINIRACRNPYIEMLNILHDTLQCFLSAPIHVDTDILSVVSLESLGPTAAEEFVLEFAVIAGHPSHSVHLKEFIAFVLNIFNTNQITQLKRLLSAPFTIRGLYWLNNIARLQTSRRNALNLLEGLEIPFRLQYLARQTILRSLSYR